MPNSLDLPYQKRLRPGRASAVGLLACLCAVIATGPARLTAAELVLHDFASSSLQGSSPYSGLFRDKAGALYGTTVYGGASGKGTVYRVGANGGETVLYSFMGPDGANPYGGVIDDDRGNLYGTTFGGGASGAGVIFKLDRSGVETVLYSFTGGADGGNPHGGVVRDSQGNLYGTTEYGGISCLPNSPFGPPTPPCGVVFKLDTAGNETVLYSFVIGSGVNPPSGLTMDAAGDLYGVSQDDGNSYGVVYKINAAGQFSVYYGFYSIIGPMSPYAAPTLDTAGNVYGTTTAIFGGSGTVYKLSSPGVETTLLTFPGGIGSAQPYGGVVFDAEGNLYGTTYSTPSSFPPAGPGTVYKLTPGGTYTALYTFSGGADGGHPTDTLVIDSEGNLYGTASTGGDANAGVVFKVDPFGAETVLYSFLEAPGGTTPIGPVTRGGSGDLFGTTSTGGAHGAGTVFITDAAGVETVLYSFTGGTDGGEPLSGVIAGGGNLFGVAAFGGVNNNGVVYKVDSTGTESVIYSFLGGSDGFAPYGRLTKDAAGNLYGTTAGSASGGTVYRIDPSGNKTTLHSFDGTDGQNPYSGVTLDASGNIYGTTTFAGSTDSGTVYKLSSSGEELLVYSFLGATDGSDPYAGVILDSAGNLYGTTVYGGTGGAGTVYKLDPNFNKTVLYNFTGGSDGANPYASLLLNKAGNVYGTTQNGGANGKGVVFELNAAGKETVLYSFSGTDGQAPVAGLNVDESGDLYGTTPSGGSKSGGVIFEITPGSSPQ